jgi:hypothetical protein
MALPQMNDTNSSTAALNFQSLTKLLLWSLALLIIWLVILPQVQKLKFIAQHIDFMKQRDVNPAAMYYTELEKLPLRTPSIEQALVLWP